jgi:RHS repeat-associated protein
VTRTHFDQLGRRDSVTDPAGNVTSFGYDEAGRLTTVTDAKQAVTQYGYDSRGNRTSVTDANRHTTSFAYDLSNRLGQEVVPDQIMTTGYNYDSAGNRTGKVDGKNQTTGFVYDASRRLTDINYASGPPAHFAYDEHGNKSVETNGDSERHMTYDLLGRLTHVQDVTVGHDIDYTYDAAGNRTSMTVLPENETTRYFWDSRSLLSSMVDAEGGIYRFAYDKAGRRVTTVYPNAMTLSTTYDSASRVLSMVYAKKDGSVIESFTYTYDSRGNRLSKIFADGTVEEYRYDELSRLVQATYPSGRTVEYSYDAVGNRTVKVEGQASNTGPTCAGDADCDGVPDNLDNCPNVANADQTDSDRGPISSGLRYGFRFEEPAGTSTQDVRKSVLGTIVGTGATRLAGQSGRAISFPGNTTAGVSIPHGPATDITGNAMSISAWIKRSGPSYGPVVGKGGQYGLWVGYGPIGVKFVKTGALFLGGQNGSGLPAGVWTHVVATWDGSVIRYYQNGNYVTSETPTAGAITSFNTPVLMGCNTTTDTTVGMKCSGQYSGFNGAIDEVGVWDRVLSLDEIHALYHGPLVDEDGKGDACDPCPNTTDTTCAPTTCLDEDGDGYGVPGASACSAGHPDQFDCDDHNPTVHPGAVEACDGVDNNCNGLVDDACLGAPVTMKYHYNSFNQLLKSGVSTVCAANDTDCDGVPDTQDNCPLVYNPGQEDSDSSKPTALAADALAVWGFEEGSGTVAKDGIGSHDGTLLNGAGWTAGRFGRGLQVDGVDDRVWMSNLTRPSGPFSLELWVNLMAAGPYLVDFGSAQPIFGLWGTAWGKNQPSGSFGTVPMNQWTHLAATWNGSTMRMYINGSEVGNSTGTLGAANAGLTIGSQRNGSWPAKGAIDEVAVFSRELSAAEVQTHSQNRLVGDGMGDACDPCLGNGDANCRPTTCIDEDGDGYGIQGASNCAAGHPELFDCNDHDASVHPGAVDVPWDGVDNDCNGYPDEPMQQATTYQWDGNGNLVSDGVTNYSWDARDRLVSNGYGYDTSNLRTKMGAQKVLLDGIEEAREYGTNELRYDHDPSRVDGLLAQKSSAGKGYFVTDALGSVYVVVDSTGAKVSKYSYDVYGAKTATTEGMSTNWGFTGRRQDSSTEMYYRARYRDSLPSVWASPDPLGMADGPNRFLYAHVNPVSKSDPLGTMVPASDWGSLSTPGRTISGLVFDPIPYTGVPDEHLSSVWRAISFVDAALAMPSCRQFLGGTCGSNRNPDLDGLYGSVSVYYLLTSIQTVHWQGQNEVIPFEIGGINFRLPGGHGIAYNDIPVRYGDAVLAGVLLHEFAHIVGYNKEDEANEITTLCGLPSLTGSQR